ncbi:hypothetical protein GCM10027035_06480 [Emticicia sediminis]
MTEYVLKLIKENKRTKSKFLDLGHCYLKNELPKELFDCNWLEGLNLGTWFFDKKNVETRTANDLSKNYFESAELSKLSVLSNLKRLYLSNTQISDISFLKNLTSLIDLDFSDNQISNISFLKNLTNLERLDLRSNQISDISFLANLTNLNHLYLSHNQISDISFLKNLISLNYLYLRSNQINDISSLANLTSLTNLQINGNPFEEKYQLKLEFFKNHLPQIKNILERQNEVQKQKVKLPAKVLLLGNHKSGKSSMLYYLQENKINYSGDSTHLLKVELFPLTEKEETKAIFYDFGGQDYYHGLYRVFLSSGSIYLLLWHTNNNKNTRQDKDTNKQGNLNFDVNYWLGQKAYLESDKEIIVGFEEKKSKKAKDPLLLIQTYAKPNESPLHVINMQDDAIKNRFYVSFSDKESPAPNSNEFALAYLKAEIENLIESKRYEIEEAVWYIEFYNYVINADEATALPIKKLLDYYKPSNKNEDEALASLKVELQQFHYQGLVLYYPKINPDIVWLNPAGLVKYVHENILQFDKLIGFRGVIPVEQFAKVDKNILALLKEQKVIFEHQYGEKGKEYIIPNYLPLVKSDDTEYQLFTFGLNNLVFVLRFKDFLPFGLINQMICFFGRLPDKKKFWRDQLLFTFEKSWKIFIQLDFENLEIKVHAVSDPNQKQISEAEMISYLFYCIMAMYWDMRILDFKGFHHTRQYAKKPDEINRQSLDDELIKNDLSLAPVIEYQQLFSEEDLRPSDLLVSRNGIDFVDYKTLCEKSQDSTKITASRLVENIEKSFEIPIKPYEVFTNKTFTKMKKIFISYSNQDIYFKKELEKYLQPFAQFKLAKSWSCEEITPGLWDEQIQSELESSDVIVFMLSINFVNSDYILKEEVLKTIKAVNENPNKKIVCVVVKNFPWQLFNKMADSVGISKADLEILSTSTDDEKKQEALLKLADYQFLPYFTEAKEKESKRYLHPLNKWQHEEDAYSQIAEKIMTVL